MKPVPARGGESFLRNAIAIELAGRDRFVYSCKILKDDAAGAQIEMADFGVAHLALRQTYVGAAGAELAAGIIAIELIVKRRVREQSGIAVFFRLRFAAGIDAPAVANDEQHRASHKPHCRKIAEIDKRFFVSGHLRRSSVFATLRRDK